jgi:hypothetical protein
MKFKLNGIYIYSGGFKYIISNIIGVCVCVCYVAHFKF